MGRGTTFSPSVSKSSPVRPKLVLTRRVPNPEGTCLCDPDLHTRPPATPASLAAHSASRPLRQREETRPLALRRRFPRPVGALATPQTPWSQPRHNRPARAGLRGFRGPALREARGAGETAVPANRRSRGALARFQRT